MEDKPVIKDELLAENEIEVVDVAEDEPDVKYLSFSENGTEAELLGENGTEPEDVPDIKFLLFTENGSEVTALDKERLLTESGALTTGGSEIEDASRTKAETV